MFILMDVWLHQLVKNCSANLHHCFTKLRYCAVLFLNEKKKQDLNKKWKCFVIRYLLKITPHDFAKCHSTSRHTIQYKTRLLKLKFHKTYTPVEYFISLEASLSFYALITCTCMFGWKLQDRKHACKSWKWNPICTIICINIYVWIAIYVSRFQIDALCADWALQVLLVMIDIDSSLFLTCISIPGTGQNICFEFCLFPYLNFRMLPCKTRGHSEIDSCEIWKPIARMFAIL